MDHYKYKEWWDSYWCCFWWSNCIFLPHKFNHYTCDFFNFVLPKFSQHTCNLNRLICNYIIFNSQRWESFWGSDFGVILIPDWTEGHFSTSIRSRKAKTSLKSRTWYYSIKYIWILLLYVNIATFLQVARRGNKFEIYDFFYLKWRWYKVKMRPCNKKMQNAWHPYNNIIWSISRPSRERIKSTTNDYMLWCYINLVVTSLLV